MNRLTELREKITTGILGFWVKQYRISYLIVIAIIIMGGVAVLAIPKESSPSVKLGIISIGTVYIGTNPIDMDALVTDKIYKEVKNIKGIDKITSSSSLGFSNVLLTLKTSASAKDVLSDVRSAVSRVILPTDAKTPVITDIETDTSRAFSLFLYSKNQDTSKALLFERAKTIQHILEEVPGVSKVDLSAAGGGQPVSSGNGSDATYEAHIIIPEDKLNNLGLSLSAIAGIVQSNNRDQPIGNYSIGDRNYDFRIEGKNRTSFDFLKTPIPLPKGGSIQLGDIATIERKYKNDSVKMLVFQDSPGCTSTGIESSNCKKSVGLPYVGLTVNKSDSVSIFKASDDAKKKIEEAFTREEYKNFGFVYNVDLADTINDDYKELLKEALTTLALVFLAMYIFVGFSDSIFATLTLPLAFLSTFIMLNYGGYSMNFLTNFSLILSFGIAVDTIIVIVQAASRKVNVGYDPSSAIMLALREYAIPIISGVMTTIVVFIPMMILPGVMGKFLAYIPITIFGVLATGLVLAITVNSALYILFVRKRKTYIDDPAAIEYASDEEKELLALERIGKTKIPAENTPLRIRAIHSVIKWYKSILRGFLENTALRRISIAIPLVLFVLSIVFLPKYVGFDLFPATDNGSATITVTGPVGQRTEVTAKDLEGIDQLFLGYPEIKFANISINGNAATIGLTLTKSAVRKANKQRDIFAIENDILPKVSVFEQKGYKVLSEALKNGPPGSKAVGLKLIANDASKIAALINVSKEFEAHLKTIPGTKNVSRSSRDTPGEFVFKLKKDFIATTGVTPALIYGQITQNLNGVALGSIEDDGEDMRVILKTTQFLNDVKLEDVLAIPLVVGTTNYRIGDFVESNISNSIASVNRDSGDIQITVDANLDVGVDTVATQGEFQKFSNTYNFPEGISATSGGENEANAELISAVISAFFIAVIIIFAILTLQFQSFSQPVLIYYSVIMSVPFIMVGLLFTENKFSIPFGIGFIAFTGIAVNHGIILISAINENLKKGIEGITALVEAGSSRLEPMLLTTVTTVLGILPIALRDKFWSGMGFTIIFGIISASFLTLFVLKGLYYEVYLKPKKIKKNPGKKLFRRQPALVAEETTPE